MSYETIIVEKKNRIAHVILNRPESRNAMNDTLIHELIESFSLLNNDSEIKVIVISGSGESFCAGADLKQLNDIANASWEENVETGNLLLKMFHTINNSTKPVIGKIHGHAYGGGFGICSVCDIVATEENTSFCMSEVLIGITPAILGPFAIKKIGYSHFRSLGISGEIFDGNYAQDIGLVHYSVKKGTLDDTTNKIIHQLTKASPIAISEFKKFCLNIDIVDPAELFAKLRASDHGQEGLSAFLEKRPPEWVD